MGEIPPGPDLEEQFISHFRMALPAMEAGLDAGEVMNAGCDIFFRAADSLPLPDRRPFVMYWSDRHIEFWQQMNADEEAFRRRYSIPPKKKVMPTVRARQPVRPGGGYVERTFVRAVIWNVVNSIFRAFR